MKTLKVTFGCIYAALTAALGGLVVYDIVDYERTLNSFLLRYIIIGQLLFALLVYIIIGLIYLLIRRLGRPAAR